MQLFTVLRAHLCFWQAMLCRGLDVHDRHPCTSMLLLV